MDQVAEVKQKTDIVALIGSYVSLKKMGRHHKGLCPFHAEKTPSFLVNEELGLYKCFGCGAGGDVYKFLMEIEGIDFFEALTRLAERAGVKLILKNDSENDDKKLLLEIMDLSARYYHYLLTEHKEGEVARAYLKERKIDDRLIETFNIGFALPGWDGLINYLVKKKGYKESLLERVGLINKRSTGSGYYDKFRGRIMFPLQDPAGKVVGFSGRILPSIATAEDAKYMNSPETELYHKGKTLYGFYQAKQQIREKRRVVVVEGQMDLISSFGAGVGEVVAVGGTALTPEQIEMVARLSDKIIFAMDADDAGTASIKRSVDIAEKRGMNIKVVQIIGGKDPDEIARKDPKKWKEMVENSVSVYEYILDKALEKYPKTNDDRVRLVANEVIPFLAKIDQEMIRDKWAKKVADVLEVDKDSVLNEIRKARSGLAIEMKPGNVKPTVTKKNDNWIGLLINWLLLVDEEEIQKIKKWFLGIDVGGAEGKLLNFIFMNPSVIKKEGFVNELPGELKPMMEEILMNDDNGDQPSSKDVEKLAAKVARELIESSIDDLNEQLKKSEENGEGEEADRLYEEVVRLNKKSSEIAAILA